MNGRVTPVGRDTTPMEHYSTLEESKQVRLRSLSGLRKNTLTSFSPTRPEKVALSRQLSCDTRRATHISSSGLDLTEKSMLHPWSRNTQNAKYPTMETNPVSPSQRPLFFCSLFAPPFLFVPTPPHQSPIPAISEEIPALDSQLVKSGLNGYTQLSTGTVTFIFDPKLTTLCNLTFSS